MSQAILGHGDNGFGSESKSLVCVDERRLFSVDLSYMWTRLAVKTQRATLVIHRRQNVDRRGVGASLVLFASWLSASQIMSLVGTELYSGSIIFASGCN